VATTYEYSIVSLAIPFFFILILVEYAYGVAKGKNTYRLNDALTSIFIGLISRYPALLNLGFQGVVFLYISTNLDVKLLPQDGLMTWILAFVLYDLSYYWNHRMHHEIKILWATHSVHHHGEDFNLATALRQTSTGWLWKWIFYLPMILIGVPVEIFVSVAGVNLVYQFWVHTKHIGHLGFLEKIFVTPMNHSVHHAKNKEYIDANYGGVFIIWDRLFGTYVAELPTVKPVYGTVSRLNSFNPIWANFQVFINMMKDCYRTKKIKDKFKIWVAPTYWQPEDLKSEKPQKYHNLPQDKYDPSSSIDAKLFGFYQILAVSVVSVSAELFSHSLNLSDLGVFALITLWFCVFNSRLLENKRYSYAVLLFSSLAVWLSISSFSVLDQTVLPVQLLNFYMLGNILFTLTLAVINYFKSNTSVAG
jgi:sterol desaturase/sphingolipid hydroxylase (fatty acid hydroxylase superfamily)